MPFVPVPNITHIASVDTVNNPVTASQVTGSVGSVVAAVAAASGQVDVVTTTVPTPSRDLWYFSCVQGADVPALGLGSNVGLSNTAGKACAFAVAEPASNGQNLVATPQLSRVPFSNKNSIKYSWKWLRANAFSSSAAGTHWLISQFANDPSNAGFQCSNIPAASMGPGWGIYSFAGILHLVVCNGTTKTDINTGVNMSLNTWHEFDLTVAAGTATLAYDGVTVVAAAIVGVPLTASGPGWTWKADTTQQAFYTGDTVTEIQVSYA